MNILRKVKKEKYESDYAMKKKRYYQLIVNKEKNKQGETI